MRLRCAEEAGGDDDQAVRCVPRLPEEPDTKPTVKPIKTFTGKEFIALESKLPEDSKSHNGGKAE